MRRKQNKKSLKKGLHGLKEKLKLQGQKKRKLKQQRPKDNQPDENETRRETLGNLSFSPCGFFQALVAFIPFLFRNSSFSSTLCSFS
jgi:hypothetical protein